MRLFFIIILLFIFFGSNYFLDCANTYDNKNSVKNSDNWKNIKRNIKEKFNKIKTFTADVSITENKTEHIKGKIFYKGGRDTKIKMILEYPGENKAIKYVTADLEIIYFPSQNMAIKQGKKIKSISEPVSPLSISFDDAILYEENGSYYFEINLPKPDAEHMDNEVPVKMDGIINKNLGYTEKIIFVNRNGEELGIQEFNNYKLNIPIEDSEFKFMPPKDCRILLRTDSQQKTQAIVSGEEIYGRIVIGKNGAVAGEKGAYLLGTVKPLKEGLYYGGHKANKGTKLMPGTIVSADSDIIEQQLMR